MSHGKDHQRGNRTIHAERAVARNLTDLGKVLARNLLAQNRDGRGKEDADDLMADISLAALALNYVAEFATDKCRFIAVPGGQEK